MYVKISKGLCCVFCPHTDREEIITDRQEGRRLTNCSYFLVSSLSNITEILFPRICRQVCIKYRGNGGEQVMPEEKWVTSLEEFVFILLSVEITRENNEIPGTFFRELN